MAVQLHLFTFEGAKRERDAVREKESQRAGEERWEINALSKTPSAQNRKLRTMHGCTAGVPPLISRREQPSSPLP